MVWKATPPCVRRRATGRVKIQRLDFREKRFGFCSG